MRYLDSGKIIVDDLNELRKIVKAQDIDLSLIDIKESGLTSLDNLFKNMNKIKGDISFWDVSKIESLEGTFSFSSIQPDLSKWDVLNVKNMIGIFALSQFNGDISKWNTSKVENMYGIFSMAEFNGDISKWNTSNVKMMNFAFQSSKFNGDISQWNISNVTMLKYMFSNSNFDGDISQWKFNKEIDCLDIFIDNKNFMNKYNEGKKIPNTSKEFLKWFEKNRDKIHEINNLNKTDIDNYLSSFDLKGIVK